MTASRVVTLLTDFGHRDPYVGILKAVFAQVDPQLPVIDLTHAIGPQNIVEGAFAWAIAVPYIPPGSVHLGVVDPGVGSDRALIVVEWGGHTFVAPDNGLVGGVIASDPGAAVVHRLEPSRWGAKVIRPGSSTTFHGRDLLAPAAAAIASGVPIADIADPYPKADLRRPWPDPAEEADGRRGVVLLNDHYGNAITNLRHPHETDSGAESPAPVEVRIAGGAARQIPVKSHYAAAEIGEEVAIYGSAGFLEIAVRDGSAQRRGVVPGVTVWCPHGRTVP